MNTKVISQSTKVVLPPRVVEAFEHHHQMWKGMDEDNRNLLFMAIPFTKVHGQSLVLKEFANNYPTKYMHALSNGYVSKSDLQQEAVHVKELVEILFHHIK